MTQIFPPNFIQEPGGPSTPATPTTVQAPGVGPAIDVWPPTGPGTGSFPPAGDVPAFVFTPAMTQATWFVDPANSTGVASDSNSGIDAAHPVLTYNGGIVPKWGTVSPTLNQNTTITWLSTQPFSPPSLPDPVIFTPTIGSIGTTGLGAIVTIQGLLGAAQTIHTGVIGAGLLPKNRATGQLLTIDLGANTFLPGQLIQNTTKPSFAHVYRQVGASTVYQMTQPLAPAVIPVAPNGQLAVEVDTWATGDAITVYEKTGVDLVDISPTIAAYAIIAFAFPAQVQLYHLRAIDVGGVPGDNNCTIGSDVTVVECRFDTFLIDTSGSDAELTVYWNVAATVGAYNSGGTDTVTYFWGGMLIDILGGLVSWTFDFDAIIDSTPIGTLLPGSGFTVGTPIEADIGRGALGAVYIAGIVRAQGMLAFLPVPNGLGTGLSILWGPGSFDTKGSARVVYGVAAGAAAATFLNAGGLQLNGQATASHFNKATNVWTGPFAITAANLDNAAVFAGLAVNVGGASLSNQGTT